jgi:hypothetical protein
MQDQVLQVVAASENPMSPNEIAAVIGGDSEVVMAAIRSLIDSRAITYDEDWHVVELTPAEDDFDEDPEGVDPNWELRREVVTTFMGYEPWVITGYPAGRGEVKPDHICYFKRIPYSLGWKPEMIRPATPDDMELPVDQGRGYFPNPTMLEVEAIEVINALWDRGQILSVWRDTKGHWVGQVTMDVVILSEETGPTFAMAVCKAAVAAKKGWL